LIDEYKEIDNIAAKYKSKEQLLLENNLKTGVSVLIITGLLLIIVLFTFIFKTLNSNKKNLKKHTK
jgi:hypothetical protein